MGNLGKILVEALGGEKTGRVLFGGKVVDVTRRCVLLLAFLADHSLTVLRDP